MRHFKTVVGAVACALVGAGVATVVTAQDRQPEMDMAAMMEAWERAGRVGEEHKLLASLLGTWEASGTMYMGPEPTTWVGASKRSAVLGGRFIRDDFHVEDMMGQPFSGLGYSGYDNITGKYHNVWMDSMSTGMITDSGTYDAATKTFNYNGFHRDPVTGDQIPARSSVRIEGPDRHTMEMFTTAPDGSEMLNMKIVYTRK